MFGWRIRTPRTERDASRLCDGELPGNRQQALEKQLAHENDLHHKLNDWRQINTWLASRSEPETIPDLRPKVLQRVEADLIQTHEGLLRHHSPAELIPIAWGLAGAVAGILFLTAVQSSNSPTILEMDRAGDYTTTLLLPEELMILSDSPEFEPGEVQT